LLENAAVYVQGAVVRNWHVMAQNDVLLKLRFVNLPSSEQLIIIGYGKMQIGSVVDAWCSTENAANMMVDEFTRALQACFLQN